MRYLETTSPFYMDGIVYRVKPPAGNRDVEIFVLDTEVLLAGTTVYEDKLADDGSELPSTEPEMPEPLDEAADRIEHNAVVRAAIGPASVTENHGALSELRYRRFICRPPMMLMKMRRTRGPASATECPVRPKIPRLKGSMTCPWNYHSNESRF
jgi:hypothetical protein